MIFIIIIDIYDKVSQHISVGNYKLVVTSEIKTKLIDKSEYGGKIFI